MRISFLILLVNALLFTQIASAAKEDVKLKSALLKAMKTHDTKMVRALADGGYESIDRDDVLQEKIFEYLDAEREREIQAKEKVKADALAKEKAKTDAIAAKKKAKEKAKADAIAKQKAKKSAAAAAVAAKKAAEDKKKKDALAAKNKAKAKAAAKKKAEQKAAAAAVAAKKAAEKKKKDALVAKKAKEDKARKAKTAEKKRQDAAAAKKKAAAEKQAKAKKAAPKKQAAPKKAAPKVEAAPKAVIAAPVVTAPVAAAAAAPLTVSNKEFLGTWKQISSEKVITLTIEEDTSFTLEQIEDDGTLTISGTWKSEENIFMMTIKRVQRNVHTRETNIHRIYKVERLSKHRLVLRDKRNRIAYDLKR